MINNSNKDKKIVDDKGIRDKKPNETGGFHIMSHLKIFDPNTKEILLQKRGDE